MANLPNVFASDKFSNNFVHINNCAVVNLSDRDYYTDRKEGRSDYLLIYIARGKCYATINNKEYIVNPNEAFLYHPNEPQKYYFKKEDKTIDYWVHFNGIDIDNIISSIGLSNSHHIKMNTDSFDIEQMLSRLCREFNSKENYFSQVCSGLLVTILSIMSRLANKKTLSHNTKDFIEHILGEFHSETAKKFIIDDLAKEHSITTNYLIKSFKDSTGLTPAQYLINIRINKAKELLLYSNYSLSQISEFVGYQNPAYFSRLFKTHVGVSPLKYRKENRK